MKLKLNQNLSTPKGKLNKDSIINVECDENSIPLNRFWRNRLKDSEFDNCVEIVKEIDQISLTKKSKNK